MLSHEMELEQVKMDKDSELNELQIQLQNSKSWQDKYQALLKESEAEKLQAQQNLQYKHRLEIEGLRSRLVSVHLYYKIQNTCVRLFILQLLPKY